MDTAAIDKYCPRGIPESSPNYSSHPFNHTCLYAFFQSLHARLRRYTPTEELVYTTCYVIISVLAVIGNGLVIIAVMRKRTMRSNRNVLILNLALSNLALALTNIPFLWLPSIEFEFPYSEFFCKLANVLPGSNIYCSTLTISIMAIDRYYSVKKLSLATSSRREFVRATLLSLLIWLCSFLLSLPLLISYGVGMLFVMEGVTVLDDQGAPIARSYGWRQCQLNYGEHNRMMTMVVSFTQVAFLYVIPLCVLGVFNFKLTRFLKRNANQLSRNRITRSRDLLQPSNGEISRESPDCYPPTIQRLHKQRSGTQSEQRRSRTTLLLFAMAFAYGILWLPYTIMTMLLDLGYLHGTSSDSTEIIDRLDLYFKMFSMLSTCVNPLLYGYYNTNFRQEFCDIYYSWIRCSQRPSSRYSTGLGIEYSSIALTQRRESILDSRRVISVIRRSFHSSFRSMRSSFRADNAIAYRHRINSTNQILNQSTSSNDPVASNLRLNPVSANPRGLPVPTTTNNSLNSLSVL